jgi:hypothetical protein
MLVAWKVPHAFIYREAEARKGAQSAISPRPGTDVRFSAAIDDLTLNLVNTVWICGLVGPIHQVQS